MARKFGETLWVEQIVERLGAIRTAVAPELGASFGDDSSNRRVPGPYRYVFALLVFDAVILKLIQYLRFGTTVVTDNPSWLVLPVIVVLGLATNRYLRDRYASALTDIRIERRTRDAEAAFRRLVPRAFKRNGFLAFVAVYYVYIFASGRISTIVAYEGVAGVIGWLLVAPLGYGPILVETVLMYVSIHFVLPRRFERYDVKVDFFDMQNLGGLRPIGELLKHSYYLFNAALVLFTVLLYAPFVFSEYLHTPYRPPDYVVTTLVFGLWGAGVISVGYSFWKLHRHMRSAREAFLDRFEGELDEIIPDRYDFEQIDPGDEEAYQWFEAQGKVVEQAQRTREFPATVTMWIQIVASSVLPLLIETLLRLGNRLP